MQDYAILITLKFPLITRPPRSLRHIFQPRIKINNPATGRAGWPRREAAAVVSEG